MGASIFGLFMGTLGVVSGLNALTSQKDRIGIFLFALIFIVVMLAIFGYTIPRELRRRKMVLTNCPGWIVGASDGVYIHKTLIIPSVKFSSDIFSNEDLFVFIPWSTIKSWKANTRPGGSWGDGQFHDVIESNSTIPYLQISNEWSQSLDKDLYEGLKKWLGDRLDASSLRKRSL